jgi:nucleotide-binding universal stress UspA family protein
MPASLRTLLVPLDGSALAERALDAAAAIASAAGAAVTALRVHVPIAPLTAPPAELAVGYDLHADTAVREAAERYLADLADRRGVATALEVGTPGAAITEWCAHHHPDLVVMTTHGAGGFMPAWLGSVADHVIRTSGAPVLVMPGDEAHPPAFTPPRTILVPLDGSAHAAAALAPARALGAPFGAALALVRVVPPLVRNDVLDVLAGGVPDRFGIDELTAQAKQELDAVAAELTAGGATVASAEVLVDERIAPALLTHADHVGAQLIAMATHGRGLARVFVGSVADKVLRAAGRPTLVVRPPRAP